MHTYTRARRCSSVRIQWANCVQRFSLGELPASFRTFRELSTTVPSPLLLLILLRLLLLLLLLLLLFYVLEDDRIARWKMERSCSCSSFRGSRSRIGFTLSGIIRKPARILLEFCVRAQRALSRILWIVSTTRQWQQSHRVDPIPSSFPFLTDDFFNIPCK